MKSESSKGGEMASAIEQVYLALDCVGGDRKTDKIWKVFTEGQRNYRRFSRALMRAFRKCIIDLHAKVTVGRIDAL